MANTVISLKKSATPSSVPSNLANGELAINYADGKLYYKAANGTIAAISGNESNYFGTVNANGTFVVADTPGDVLTVVSGNNISIVGDAVDDKFTVSLTNNVAVPGAMTVAGDFTHTGGNFYINNGSGAGGSSEGGEIKLANATQNQVLSGPISIDIYENKLRFFETNSPNRGAFINLAATATGVGTDLLSSSGVTDTTARNWASAAFDKANGALPNVSGISFNGNLTVSQNLTSDRVITLNNGLGENFKVGDDAWIGDTNLTNALRIKGQQNGAIGYIMFGPNDGKLLGRAGTDNLTYDGNIIWHAGTDGAGSGLDADLLDGQHGSYYGIASDVTAANRAANAAFLHANSGYAFANSIAITANAALPNTSGVSFNGNLYFPSGNVGIGTVNTAANLHVVGSVITGKLQHSPVPISKLLTAFDAAADDTFARTALSDDASVLVVGVNQWEGTTGTDRGGVYTYDWNGSSWVQRGSVLGADAAADSDLFGNGIALSSNGSVLVVGAPTWEGATGLNRGGVYTYDWNGSNWVQRGSVLEAADAADSDRFGHALALSSDGSILAVGAYAWEGATGTDRGGVYIYDWNGTSWIQRGSVLEPVDAANSDRFGQSVSLSSNGSMLAVGALEWEGTTGLNRGGVYIYDWNGTSWIQRGSVLEAADAADSDRFGTTVSLNFDGSILVVGAEYWEGATGTDRGGVYIYDWNGTSWIQRGSVLEPVDAADGDFFSRSALSRDGSILVVSAARWERTDTASNTGSVYTYSLTGALPSYSGVATGSGWIEGSNSALIARTAGLDRITVDSSGNVGIGITSPTSLLHVNGTANIVSSLLVSDMNVVPTIQVSFNQANAAIASASAGQASANAGLATANASYTFANSAHSIANLAFTHANNAFARANIANITADRAWNHANAAFDTANNALPKSGGIITGNLSITGSLTVSGNAYTIDSETLRISDPLIYLAGNNYVSDIVDIGFVANYMNTTGQNVHTGIFRDATTKEYYVFEGYDKEPVPNHIDTAGNNFTISVLNATLKTSNLILGGANAILTIGAAFNHANAAFNRANTANITADRAWNHANAAFITANVAFANANTVMISAQAAFTVANSGFIHANSAFATVNSAFATINVAFANANTVMISAQAAFTVANAAFLHANAGYAFANSIAITANLAFAHANSAYANGNVVIQTAQSAFTQANAALASAAAGQATGNAAFAFANSAHAIANLAFTHANNAYATANAALANTTGTFAGTLTATGDLKGQFLVSTFASNDEGGEVQLAKPPNGTLSGNIVIDAFQDRIRFFENGGTSRGAFIDLKACAGGAGTNLLASGTSTGGGTITIGNTVSNIFTSRSTQNTVNFIPGDNVTINVDNDDTNGRANVRISANAPGGWWAPATSVVTGNTVLAVKDTRYFLTNNSSTIVTLPATPTQGDTIYVVVTNQLANNVIARNGNKIMSLNEDLTLDITYYSIGFTYIDTNLGWVII